MTSMCTWETMIDERQEKKERRNVYQQFLGDIKTADKLYFLAVKYNQIVVLLALLYRKIYSMRLSEPLIHVDKYISMISLYVGNEKSIEYL